MTKVMHKETTNERFDRYKKQLIAIISRHAPTAKIYLFGSRARGSNREGADIDLALDAGTPLAENVIYQIQKDIDDTAIPLLVDLVDLQTTSKELANSVQKEGVLWETLP